MAELRKNEPKKGSWLARKMRHAATTPQVTVLLSRIAETTWGGRLLFHVLLRPITERSIEVSPACCRRLKVLEQAGPSTRNPHALIISCIVQCPCQKDLCSPNALANGLHPACLCATGRQCD